MSHSAQNCAPAFPNMSDRPQNRESPCEPLRPISSRDKPHARYGPPSATPGTAPSPHSPQHNPLPASEFSSATSQSSSKSSIAKSLENRRIYARNLILPFVRFSKGRRNLPFPLVAKNLSLTRKIRR